MRWITVLLLVVAACSGEPFGLSPLSDQVSASGGAGLGHRVDGSAGEPATGGADSGGYAAAFRRVAD